MGTTDLRDIAGIYLRIDGGVLDMPVIESVGAACGQAEDAGDEAVVLVHVGPVGVPDGDGRRWPGEVAIHLVNRWEQALRKLERVPAATIGVAEGDCHGPALEALLTTDYRVAAADFRIDRTGPFWPGMAIHRLANQLGVAKARGLVLSTTSLSAEDALAHGLVDEIADDPAAAVAARLRTVGGFPGKELAIRRRLLLDATTTSFEDALGAHLAACDRTLRDRPGVPTGADYWPAPAPLEGSAR